MRRRGNGVGSARSVGLSPAMVEGRGRRARGGEGGQRPAGETC